MKKLRITEMWEEGDVEFSSDPCEVVLEVDDKIVLRGNWPDHRIEGFVEAFDFLDIEYTIERFLGTRRNHNQADGF